MRFLLPFALSLTLVSSAPAAERPPTFTQSDCPSYDYTKRFGPIRDQDGFGLCWSFATAALMEEHFCLNDKKLCGESVSPLDTAYSGRAIIPYNSDDPGDGGGRTIEPLRSVFKDGVCLEKYAPFHKSLRGIGCLDPKTDWEVTKILRDRFAQFKAHCIGCTTCKEASLSPVAKRKLDSLVAGFDQILADNVKMGVNVRQAFLEAYDNQDFIQKLYITPACEKNRLKVPGFEKTDYEFTNFVNYYYRPGVGGLQTATTGERLKEVVKALKSGRSMSLEICTDQIRNPKAVCKRKPEQDKDGSDQEEGSDHVVVLNGMKWDPVQKTCLLHLRNSWGVDGDLNGWFDARTVLPASWTITYIQKDKK